MDTITPSPANDDSASEDAQYPSTTLDSNDAVDNLAGERVSRIPELLAQILFDLPLKDLLMAKRVCHAFNKTIEKSPLLQRKLFCRPSIKAERETLVIADYDHFTKIFTARKGRPAFTPVSLNPIILSPIPRGGFPTYNITTDSEGPTTYKFFDVKPRNVPAVASCRAMLLTQPPVTDISVFLHAEASIGNTWADRME